MNKTSEPKFSESKWQMVLLVISVLTLAVHAYLSLQHYQLKMGIAEGPSICNLSSTFNCDTVAVSKYATLFVAGIPLALLGFFTQFVFLIFLLCVRFGLSENLVAMKRLLFYFSSFVFAVSLVMGGISIALLGTYCLFCMAAYGLSALQLFASWKLQREALGSHFSKDLQAYFTQSRWVLVLLVLIPITAWTAHQIILDSYGFGKLNLVIEDSIRDWQAATPVEFKLDQGLSLQKTQATPKMVIVEFADFLCPHCKMASSPLESFAQSHPDVRLIFKTFPLDGKCNRSIQHQGDGARCQLAAATFCAEQLAKKGWLTHHWIFEHQEQLAKDGAGAIELIIAAVGLDSASFKSCLNTDSTTEAIQSMANEGNEAKIQGTPTIFVNGKLLPRGQVLPVMEAAYQKL